MFEGEFSFSSSLPASSFFLTGMLVLSLLLAVPNCPILLSRSVSASFLASLFFSLTDCLISFSSHRSSPKSSLEVAQVYLHRGFVGLRLGDRLERRIRRV